MDSLVSSVSETTESGILRRYGFTYDSSAIGADVLEMTPMESSELESDDLEAEQQYEIFLEACSSLYSEILDAAGFVNEAGERRLQRYHSDLIEKSHFLTDKVPRLSNIISSKLASIGLEMKKLIDNQRLSDDFTFADNRGALALNVLRKWLRATTKKVAENESRLEKSLMLDSLKRLASNQKIIHSSIETDGATLVHNAKEYSDRIAIENDATHGGAEPVEVQQTGNLKLLETLFKHLWLRSLSLAQQIDNKINDFHWKSALSSHDDSQIGWPQVKKRRLNSEALIDSSSVNANGDEKSEEEKVSDILPFCDDEYVRITADTTTILADANELLTKRGVSHLTSADSTENIDQHALLPDTGYSSGENSTNRNRNIFAISGEIRNNENQISRIGCNFTTSYSQEQQMQIEASPGKAFYRTVPLDDAGVTDTETPRLPVSLLPYNDCQLSDSLIVNADEDLESLRSDDVEEILSMLDAANNLAPTDDWNGTIWKEFTCGNHKEHKCQTAKSKCSADNVVTELSCDASNEDSDDMSIQLPRISASNIAAMQFEPNSLKRHRRSPRKRALMPIENDCIKINPPAAAVHTMPRMKFNSINRNCNRMRPRRKTKVNRTVNSLSEFGQTLNVMNVSTCSAPEPVLLNSADSLHSDILANEYSDNQPYEWDEYNPLCKSLGSWEFENFKRRSRLRNNDEYRMMSTFDPIFVNNEDNDHRKDLSNKESSDLVSRRISDRLTAIVAANPRRSSNCIDEVEKNENFNEESMNGMEWNGLSPSRQSLNDASTQLNSVTKRTNTNRVSADVLKALDVFTEVFKELFDGRKRLVLLMESEKIFPSDLLSNFFNEFEISKQACQASIEQFRSILAEKEAGQVDWKNWHEIHRNLQNAMTGMTMEFAELKKSSDMSKKVCTELEFCQDRMSCLETFCNYITTNLSAAQKTPSPSFDIASELAVCSNALLMLKSKLEYNIAKSTSNKSTDTSYGFLQKQQLFKNMPTIECIEAAKLSSELSGAVYHPLKAILVLMGILAVVFAWFTSMADSSDVNNWRNTLSIHLDYVNGPPPA